jgi:serine-aspartate repeat-containing protein C/D/E
VSSQGNWTYLNITNSTRITSDYDGGGAPQYTWHLSVVDAGNPRGEPVTLQHPDMWLNASHLKRARWLEQNLRDGSWKLGKLESVPDKSDVILSDEFAEQLFGLQNGIPFAGDFNGDGRFEVGVYLDGEWFVDLNGNGKWDPEDLWAKLGNAADRPVVGDWDGDGKDDIGIYGPEWEDDEPVIAADPGLPDQFNRQEIAHSKVKQPHIKPKNVPPVVSEANERHRALKRSERGSIRGDLIDHVFRFGAERDMPVTGDFNGDGIDSIGVFREGVWRIDVDGDGRLTGHDKIVQFGQPGDVPVVGDFNGDQVDEIGVYRNGQWIIDIDRDLELSAHDKVFEMGGEGDLPVVGDWDGDGTDDPGTFKPVTGAAARTAALEP